MRPTKNITILSKERLDLPPKNVPNLDHVSILNVSSELFSLPKVKWDRHNPITICAVPIAGQ